MNKNVIRNLYLYVVAAVALFMIAFSVVDLVNLGLRTWVFTKADQTYYAPAPVDCAQIAPKDPTYKCPTAEDLKKQQDDQRAAQRQQDLVRNISLLIVGIPLFTYHWMVIRRDRSQDA